MDVTIRSLRVHIVRHGTLFWGDDPRAIARRCLGQWTALFEDEVQRAVDEATPQSSLVGVNDDDWQVTEPLRLTVRLRARDLLTPAPFPREHLEHVRLALHRALQATQPRPSAESGVATTSAPPSRTTSPPPILGTLLALFIEGSLAKRLEDTSLSDLLDWHERLLERPANGAEPVEFTARDRADVETLLRQVIGEVTAQLREPREPLALLRLRLRAAVTIAAQLGHSPYSSSVRELLDKHCPRPAAPARTHEPLRARDDATALSTPVAITKPVVTQSPAQKRRRAEPTPDREVGLLALLCAAELQRSGGLRVLGATLTEDEREPNLALIVSALALKLEDPAERGWFYPPTVLARVAAAGGLAVVAPESFSALADHPRGRWSARADDVRAVLKAPGHASLVDVGALRAEFDSRENVVGLGPQTDQPALGGDASGALLELMTRVVAPRARHPQFEWVLTTLAAWSLSQLGRRLWPNEQLPALNAWSRFATFTARLVTREECCTAWVPLGPRYADARRARCLDDLEPALWLGKPLHFRGG